MKRRHNPVIRFHPQEEKDFVEQWLEDGEEIAADHSRQRDEYTVRLMKLVVVTRSNGLVVEWALLNNKRVIGAGAFAVDPQGPKEYGVAFAKRYRGRGLHRDVLRVLRERHFKRPILSDKDRSEGNDSSWRKLGAEYLDGVDRYRMNPGILTGPKGRSLRPLDHSKLKGVVNAYIAPDGDVYRVRGPEPTVLLGAYTHDRWAQAYLGVSEKALEDAGWAKVQWGSLQYEGYLTEPQRDAVEQWEVQNRKRMTNPRVSLLPAPRLSARARRGLAAGARIEMEHTRSRRAAAVIASHHLAEHPGYYRALVKMERRLKRNPKLGNTGWEFIARADLQELQEALGEATGKTPPLDVVADAADTAFRYALIEITSKANRIPPMSARPAMRHQVVQSLIKMVKSGAMQLPG